MTRIDADKVQGEGSAVHLDSSALVSHPDARMGFEEYTNRVPIKSITCRQRRLDASTVPSATVPIETDLSVWQGPDFPVVFKGYAGRAVDRPLRQKGQIGTLRTDILSTC